jgi:Zn-dependent oligopeptidase
LEHVCKRGDNENDNKATLVQILQLRKSKITWFPTFAHWNLSNKMAKTPERNGVDDVSMGACGCASA